MKVLLKSVGVLFCLAIFYSCDSSSSKSKELSDFIPEEVSVVFKIKDFEALKSDLKNNGFLSQIKKTAPYSFYLPIK